MRYMLSRQRFPQLRCSAAVVTQPLAWRDIQHQAGDDVLRDYVIRRGQAPGTAPHPVVPTQRMTAPQSKPVLLWRDTNAWCPFCERVRMHKRLISSAALRLAILDQQYHRVTGSGNDMLSAGLDGTFRKGHRL